jgi:hypothetical protein
MALDEQWNELTNRATVEGVIVVHDRRDGVRRRHPGVFRLKALHGVLNSRPFACLDHYLLFEPRSPAGQHCGGLTLIRQPRQPLLARTRRQSSRASGLRSAIASMIDPVSEPRSTAQPARLHRGDDASTSRRCTWFAAHQVAQGNQCRRPRDDGLDHLRGTQPVTFTQEVRGPVETVGWCHQPFSDDPTFRLRRYLSTHVPSSLRNGTGDQVAGGGMRRSSLMTGAERMTRNPMAASGITHRLCTGVLI